MKKYAINEIFYSIQGEGGRAGEASIFVRFQACNLRCAVEAGPLSPGGFSCDTEFESGRLMESDEILHEVRRVGESCRWIIFTGGEPGLQLDAGLVRIFHEQGYRCAIETNGTVDVSGLGLDWICVSPKVAEHAIQQTVADEVKYVRNVGQVAPKTRVEAKLKYISPAFDTRGLDADTLHWCIELVKENPEWRLSLQLHKFWGVR